MTKSQLKQHIEKFPVVMAMATVCWNWIKTVKKKRYRRRLGKAQLQKLSGMEAGRARIWYVCVPTHPNLGDQAQACCIFQWLGENYPASEIVEITSLGFDYAEGETLKRLHALIRPSDLIVFQSGYTMTGTHEYESCRSKIIRNFPENSTVIFPQTLQYANDALRQQAISAYDGRKNLMLLVRDRTSYEMARGMFGNLKVFLYPDIVTTQIGTRRYDGERNGILFCMRNDDEKLYGDREIDMLIRALSSAYRVEKTDTTLKLDCLATHKELWAVLEGVFAKYAGYRLVITDRYHGTIFALISNTPVIVLNSTDHKLKTGIEWFKGIYDDYVFHAETLEEVDGLVSDVMRRTCAYSVKEHFDSMYYKKLKVLMERSFA